MISDPRSNKEATLSLLSPAMPKTPWEQMKEKHGAGESFLRILGTGLSGGLLGNLLMPEMSKEGKAKYAADMGLYKAEQERANIRREQSDFFSGLDMDNLTMAEIAQISDFDAGLGKIALENYAFNQQVGDLGRAQGFLNDGIEDENDLWAQETNLRYGRTGGGQQTSLTSVLNNAQMTQSEFEALPAEAQRAVLYQHGTDEDRRAMDRVAGRQTLEQIEAEGAAKGIGEASGALTAEAIGFIPNAPAIAADQKYALAGAQGVIDLIKGGDINTGKWANMVKDTFNIQTKADGTLGYQATQALIQQINSATFGALSEREIATLEKMFANGEYNEEQNLGVMEGVMQKIRHEQEKHSRKTEESLRRVKDYAPDEYDHFMQDDNNWLDYGDGAKISDVGGMDFRSYYEANAAEGKSRSQIVNDWAEQEKMFKEAEEQRKEQEDAASAKAEEYLKSLADLQSETYGILRANGN